MSLALSTLSDTTLVTTLPCIVEAMYLLGRAGGLSAQEELWGFLADELVNLDQSDAREWERLRELMRQYHDSPMDFADASLVAAAERLNCRRIFTLDHHFRAFRIFGKDSFDIVG